jgi:hypothetical protein
VSSDDLRDELRAYALAFGDDSEYLPGGSRLGETPDVDAVEQPLGPEDHDAGDDGHAPTYDDGETPTFKAKSGGQLMSPSHPLTPGPKGESASAAARYVWGNWEGRR